MQLRTCSPSEPTSDPATRLVNARARKDVIRMLLGELDAVWEQNDALPMERQVLYLI